MKTTILFCLTLLASTSSLAQAQPAIRAANGVLNASSGLPDVAQGSWFIVCGTGLGPATLSVQTAPPYPAQLSETSIAFTPASGGTPVSALMYYTSATQIAGLLPSSTPAGAYNVTVTYNGQTSAAYPANVVAHNFGFATETSNGQGPAQATYNNYVLNRFTTGTLLQWGLRPANPGDLMVLWGTGIGADPASDITGGTSGDQTATAQVQRDGGRNRGDPAVCRAVQRFAGAGSNRLHGSVERDAQLFRQPSGDGRRPAFQSGIDRGGGRGCRPLAPARR